MRKTNYQEPQSIVHCITFLCSQTSNFVSRLFPIHSSSTVPWRKIYVYLRSLDGAISSPAASALYCVQHPACPVFEKVGNVAESVAMGEQIPTPCAVAVVIKPRAENEVCRDAKEDATEAISHGFNRLSQHKGDATLT